MEDIKPLLRRTAKKHGTQQKFAAFLGVSGAYLSDVMQGKREPGESILKPLGYEKVVSYRKRRPDAAPASR